MSHHVDFKFRLEQVHKVASFCENLLFIVIRHEKSLQDSLSPILSSENFVDINFNTPGPIDHARAETRGVVDRVLFCICHMTVNYVQQAFLHFDPILSLPRKEMYTQNLALVTTQNSLVEAYLSHRFPQKFFE